MIAVDQDRLGIQAQRIFKDGDSEVWARPLQGGGRAVVLLNRSQLPRHIVVNWEQLHYPAHFRAAVRDLWRHTDLKTASRSFGADVPGHGVVMVTITP